MQVHLPDLVKQWERNRDWKTGVKIYEDHGSDAGLKVLFNCPKTAFSEKKLLDALRSLALTKSAPIILPKPAATKEAVTVSIDVMPDFISDIEKRRKDLFKEFADFRARLFVKMPDEERKVIAFKVIEAQKQINELWYQIDYWKEHGVLPEAVKPSSLSAKPIEWLLLRKSNLITYLAPKRYKDPEKPSTKQKIEGFRLELAAIENELKNR